MSQSIVTTISDTWPAKFLVKLFNPAISTPRLERLYRQAWGRPWMQQIIEIDAHEEMASANAISSVHDDSALLHPDFNRTDYYTGSWIERENEVPLQLRARYYEGIAGLKKVLYSRSDPGDEDVLLVRSEFLELEREFETSSALGIKGAVITGQIDTGKAMFLLYMFLRRLEQKLPTAIQLYADEYLIFDAHGATAFHVKDIPPDRISACVALIDSSTNPNHPCDALLSAATFVLQVAKPELHRWETWSTHHGADLFIMELPSIMEVLAIAKLLNISTRLAIDLMRKWGPSLKTVIDLASIQDDVHRQLEEERVLTSMKAAATQMSKDPLVLETARYILMSDASKNVSAPLFIRPTPETTDDGNQIFNRVRGLPSLPTRYLRDIYHESCGA